MRDYDSVGDARPSECPGSKSQNPKTTRQGAVAVGTALPRSSSTPSSPSGPHSLPSGPHHLVPASGRCADGWRSLPRIPWLEEAQRCNLSVVAALSLTSVSQVIRWKATICLIPETPIWGMNPSAGTGAAQRQESPDVPRRRRQGPSTLLVGFRV